MPQGKLQQVTFDLDWAEFSNDDLSDDDDPNPSPDKGWYVTVNAADGSSGYVGPDHFGPGFATTDDALAAVQKWAEDRGYRYEPPSITVTVGRWL